MSRRPPGRLPGFIVAGAPRSGTTWLYRYLDAHPEVGMAQPAVPEPKFFLVDDEYAKGLGYYSSRWFDGLPPGVLAGEKSSNYLESAVAAERVHRDLPDVRLVFSLRDPAERALSNYLWSKMNGMEDLPFDEALAAEREREAGYPAALRYARPHSYFSRGLYAELLEPWLERFPRQHVLVLRFEDLVERPREVAADACSFLGVTPVVEHAAALGVVNPSTEGGGSAAAALDGLRQAYAEPNRRLARLLGHDGPLWDDDRSS
jgi:hypothetical protein